MTPKNEVKYEKEMFRSPSGIIGILSYTHFNNCTVTTRNTPKPTPKQQTWNGKFFAHVHAHVQKLTSIIPRSVIPTTIMNEFMHL